MRISIESNGISVTDEMDRQIRTKVAKLEHYFENIVDAIVYLHDLPNLKEVEIKLNVRSDTLFVREQGDNYLAALDVAMDIMKRNLTKYKERTLKNI